jgi:anthranilate synthase component 1
MPRFCGGLAGYFGYDAVRYIEKSWPTAPARRPGPARHPAAADRRTGRHRQPVRQALPDRLRRPAQPEAFSRGRQRLRDLRRCCAAADAPVTTRRCDRTIREFAKDDYLAAVHKAKEYIMAGDMMQVQVGQRMKPYRDSPLSLYRALRSLNPSPYMYFYNFGDFQMVGASPEILVRNEATATARSSRSARWPAPARAAARPSATPAGHRTAGRPKEIAEHVMLIDLARNDIGRIAETGSVKVTDKMVIEKYSHVQHIVSRRRHAARRHEQPGRAARHLPGRHAVRRAQGARDGNHRRTGTAQARHLRRRLGYLSFGGEMDLAIAIRTGVIKDGICTCRPRPASWPTGPRSRMEETEAKARAVIRAAEQVQDGLDADL